MARRSASSSSSTPVLPIVLALGAVAGLVWMSRSKTAAAAPGPVLAPRPVGAGMPMPAAGMPLPGAVPAGTPMNPTPRPAGTIPVYLPNGDRVYARVDDALDDGNFFEATVNNLSVGFRALQVDKAGRVVRADNGDGKPVTIPFDTITQIL